MDLESIQSSTPPENHPKCGGVDGSICFQRTEQATEFFFDKLPKIFQYSFGLILILVPANKGLQGSVKVLGAIRFAKFATGVVPSLHRLATEKQAKPGFTAEQAITTMGLVCDITTLGLFLDAYTPFNLGNLGRKITDGIFKVTWFGCATTAVAIEVRKARQDKEHLKSVSLWASVVHALCVSSSILIGSSQKIWAKALVGTLGIASGVAGVTAIAIDWDKARKEARLRREAEHKPPAEPKQEPVEA